MVVIIKEGHCVICGDEAAYSTQAKYKSGIVIENLCERHKIIDEQIRRFR